MNLKVTKKVTVLNAYYSKNAFTLIELLVGITIITILALGATSLDFNRLSNRQKLEIFTNTIKTDYESIRNNALEGKGIGVNLDVPKKWKMEFSKSNSGTILTSYSLDGDSWTGTTTIDFQNKYGISSIVCKDVNGILVGTGLIDTETGSIELSGVNTTLDGIGNDCSNVKSKIIEITFWNKINEYKKLEINTLNGLINTK